jgi:hypothetical protein
MIYMTDGTLLQREVTPGGGTYATIPQCMNITPPKIQRKKTEVPIHDQSTPVTKRGGMEAMELTFEVAWDPANSYHAALRSDANDKTERSYQIVLPDSGAYQMRFSGGVDSFEFDDFDAEGKALKATVTVGLTTVVTDTP